MGFTLLPAQLTQSRCGCERNCLPVTFVVQMEGDRGREKRERGRGDTTSSALLQLVRFFVGVYFWNTLRLLYNCELTETPTAQPTVKLTATPTVTAL